MIGHEMIGHEMFSIIWCDYAKCHGHGDLKC